MLIFFHEMCWMRSGTELSQFLRVFLPTLFTYNTDLTMSANAIFCFKSISQCILYDLNLENKTFLLFPLALLLLL